jgi:hypothetical protein
MTQATYTGPLTRQLQRDLDADFGRAFRKLRRASLVLCRVRRECDAERLIVRLSAAAHDLHAVHDGWGFFAPFGVLPDVMAFSGAECTLAMTAIEYARTARDAREVEPGTVEQANADAALAAMCDELIAAALAVGGRK